MTEQFTNNATTTLTTAALSTDTTVTVASATLFPAAAQFRILIDSEIMLVTNLSGVGNTTFTVTRGAEGTIATAHNNGANVEHILTAGAITQLKLDTSSISTTVDVFANRPAGVKGQQFIPTDVGYHQYFDGTAWRNLIEGKTFTQPPTASNWTIVNNSGVLTLADNGGSLRAFTNVAAQYDLASVPYVSGTFLEAAFFAENSGLAATNTDDFTGFGIFMRDNTNRTTHFQFKSNNRNNAGTSFYWPNYNSDLRTGNGATYVSTQLAAGAISSARGVVIMRMTLSGGNLSYSASLDGGRNYTTLFTQAASAISFGTLTSYGLVFEVGTADSIDMSVVHFKTG